MSDDEIEGLDDGIRQAVTILRESGIETFESCEGGDGHAFHEPTIRFYGDPSEGWKALATAHQNGLGVSELRRAWSVNDGEPCGPYWELVFTSRVY